MERQWQLSWDGQAVNREDINTHGEVAALADDRVFAELFRMAPTPDGTTIAKGVLPPSNAALVAPNGATGSVVVNPFRAFVGSRTVAATEARKNLRDIRSALSVAVGATALTTTVALAANPGGSPRWDLVAAKVTIDTPTDSATRKVKNVGTGVVTSVTTATSVWSTCSLVVVQGTASLTPDWPAITADSGSDYYVPLAYVRVPSGFTSGSTIPATDIADVAPVLSLSPATGAQRLQIANGQYTAGSAQFTTAMIHTWGSTGVRPSTYVPQVMGGGDSLLVVASLETGAESLVTNAVVDSRDWRNRLVRWTAHVAGIGGGTTDFAWMRNTFVVPAATDESDSTLRNDGAAAVAVGVGQTFKGSTANAAYLIGDYLAQMPNGAIVKIVCDHGDGGKLKLQYSGAPNCSVIFWLDFSAAWPNA